MKDPLAYYRRTLIDLMKGVFLRDKESFRKGRKRFKKQFPESEAEETKKAEETTSVSERWWAAKKRSPGKEESKRQCGQCARLLKAAAVKDCPGCGVVLHAVCYDEGAGGYKTPGCRACYHRTYFK